LPFIALFPGTLLAGNLKVNIAPSQAVSAGAQWRVDGGIWRNSGVTVTNLTNAAHSIEYKTITGGWVAPGPGTVTLTNGVTTTVTGTYASPASIVVTLTPSNGQWRVDGGAWQNSGTTATGLTPGAHSISYNALANYMAPATENGTLVSGQTTSLARSYTATNLTITLTPSNGQWRVDGGAWRNSGTTATGLTAGAHSISYNALANYIAPATENVTLVSGQTTSLARSYTATSNLTITLTPSNGQWRVDGGAWRNSGTTATGLPPGAHSVSYNALANYVTPATENVTLISGQTTSFTRAYILPSTLRVNLTPSTASWQLDGGTWQASGATLSGLTPGSHTVAYSGVSNMLAPVTETVTLTSGQTTTLARSYTPAGQVFVMLNPSTAQWRVDGGAWRATHTSSGLVAAGSHTIEYSPVSTYLTPPPETVTVVASQTLNISTFYTAESALIVNLSPAVGQWRIDGGAWQNSGTRVGQLTDGNHAIQYSAAAGYSAPPDETIFLGTGATQTIARTYLHPASVTVNVVPSNGQWRLYGGAWQASGATISGLRPGDYGIQFESVPGWFDVPDYGITLAEGENKTASYEHLRHATITITLAPGTAQWRVNGGAWQSSGATVGALFPGNYTVNYSTVSGFTTPASENIALAAGEQKSINRSYSSSSSLTVTLSPSGGTWSVDGGPWQNSGTTASGLTPGAHGISYSVLANYITPPTETITLGLNETASLARSYTPAGQIFVTLFPGTAQWRVDGGVWRATSTSSGLIAAGPHTIEYSTVENYLTPPIDTVTLAASQTLTISKTYTADFGASLNVKTIPAYLSEIGVVQWRLDGGGWNPAGASVSVNPGTHTLEFQPVAGLDVPPASSVTISAGATETLEATFYLTHRLRFFLHPDLVAGLSTEDLQARLSQYAAHLQTIWHRESLRRLTFNPATDITILSVCPFSNNAYPPLPEYGFELWVHADSSNGSIYGSNGGVAGLDVSGAGGADGMHWTQIYDPSTLTPDSTELYEYWKQIDTTIHEFEHVFGAGLGEYYSFSGFDDLTGVAPFYDVDYFVPADPFWNARPDFWSDPLLRYAFDNYRLGDPTALPSLLDAVHFSGASRGIINGCYRNADSPFTTRTALPDLSHIRISVVDANSGQPIPNATLRIWNRPNPGPTGGQERTVVSTDTPGVFEFNWTADSSYTPLNNWDNGKLLKAFASGYQPKAQWEWIYDAQRVKTVDNADVWQITVALSPAP